jgi:2-polyprenyl-3-methyl-5-hydroxy-6-metoxy-1,4-benzoquinol methylase
MTDKEHISDWWAGNPMTYGKDHGTAVYKIDDSEIVCEIGSKQFFEIADRQLVKWNEPLHDSSGYFGKIFPYANYRNRSVLEIGCGMGGMAMLWAQHGANITAIDLNPVAVEQTKRRFELFNLSGNIQQNDASKLPFSDDYFNYVYSWGVLHHSPHLEHSISELFRVLRPGGEFGVMLYHRNSLLHFYQIIYVEGILHAEFRFLDHLQLASRYGDGYRQEGNPHTWPVTKKEVRSLLAPHTSSFKTSVLGTDVGGLMRFMLPGLYYLVPTFVKKTWARRFGWSLWISGKKVG